MSRPPPFARARRGRLERPARQIDVAVQGDLAAVLEHMGHRHRRVDPVELKREIAESRRGRGQREKPRARVVDKTRERQLRGPHGTARPRRRLEHHDLARLGPA
jgi:hypothetical protein